MNIMENYYFKHPSHFGEMFGIFEDFYRNKTLSDVIITCQGRNIHAHRIVLCAGSDYFRKLLTSIKFHNHLPVLLITDISYDDIDSILEFIYRGQIVVTRDKVESLRQAAFKLRVKGFENFLRKTFGCMGGFGGQMRIHNGGSNMRGTSLLNDSHKRILQQINEIEIKKLKMSHNNSNILSERLIYNNNHHNINRFNREEFKRLAQQQQQQPHHSSPQLEAALQRGHNGVKKMIQEQYLKRNNSNNNGVYDLNGTLDLKMEKPPMLPEMTITPLPNVSNQQSCASMEHSGSSSLSDTYDENDDNQKNESTEIAMDKSLLNGNIKNKDSLIAPFENGFKHSENNSKRNNNCENGNNNNLKNDKEDYDSEDSQEVNYTYEMDPNVLTNWDGSEENINNFPIEMVVRDGSGGGDEFDGIEEEDYFESYIRNSNASFPSNCINPRILANGFANANGNGHQSFFACEHCPKYFYDEDHLQIHIKRNHDLNKMNQCNICGKAYAWKSGLYKHKRHVHNIGGTTIKPITQGSSSSPQDNNNMIINNLPESPNNENSNSNSVSESPSPTPQSGPPQQSSMEALKVANNNSVPATA